MYLHLPILKVVAIKVLTAWAFFLLTKLEPNAAWKDTYPVTAAAFANSAITSPLFDGDDGPRRTVALYTSLSWYESGFNPKAEGDSACLAWSQPTEAELEVAASKSVQPKAKCLKKGSPHSFCLGQINDSNFVGLGVTRETLFEGEKNEQGEVTRSGTDVCVAAMNRMLRKSLQICRTHPLVDRLGWYAGGGDGCTRGFPESRNRVKKALWLLANHPILSEEAANID